MGKKKNKGSGNSYTSSTSGSGSSAGERLPDRGSGSSAGKGKRPKKPSPGHVWNYPEGRWVPAGYMVYQADLSVSPDPGKPPKKPSGDDSGSGSGYGYGGGGGGGGGGAVVDPEPSKTEARAIVMAGMKQYLGREASKKEVNSFFEKFKAFSVENKDTGVSAGMQTEFMEDWIEDRPQLRKQEAQYKVNTQFMGVLEDVISNARSL